MNATCEIVKALKKRHGRFLNFRDDARKANNEKLATLWQDRADVVSGVLTEVREICEIFDVQVP